jgi:long-chain acyl-CoA synthetase
MRKNTTDTTLPKNLPLLYKLRAENDGQLYAQAAKNSKGVFEYYTFAQLYRSILECALALKENGINRGDRVAFISDNRREWLITDIAIQSLGAADVPRGCDSMGSELCYIIAYAECKAAIFENGRQLSKVLEKVADVPLLKTAILFDAPEESVVKAAEKEGIKVILFSDLTTHGAEIAKNDPASITSLEESLQTISGDDIATMIFTSGTTGTPKGVMLSHRNYMAQLEQMHNVLTVKPGDIWLSILPVWHSFERVVQYINATLKSCLAYSKPVAPIMLADIEQVKPQWICGVPRLWEALAQGIYRTIRKAGGITLTMFNFFVAIGRKYSWAKLHVKGLVCRYTNRSRIIDFLVGIFPLILLAIPNALGDVLIFRKLRAKLGGRLVAAISGGGALQPETDSFYRAINLNLLEGYGITEAAPVLAFRNCNEPRPGSVGIVFPSAEVKIVAEEHGTILSPEPLKPGQRGLILARGDQIMKGYYKQPELTAQAIDKDGWLNTGDVGMLTYDNEIKITGRAKDTIVLLGGENIEPLGIENALCGSNYIETAVLFGQDQKYLAALIVPSHDLIDDFAKNNGIIYTSYADLLETPEVQNLLHSEIESRINLSTGFRTCERIFRFKLLPESFKVGVELSAKQEFMRYKINEKYSKEIESLFIE